MGNREIAEYLISQGARIDIFAAAMLGRLDIVKAMLTAWPGLLQSKGPHGITLLRHARAGREHAKAVEDYLLSLGASASAPAGRYGETSPKLAVHFVASGGGA